jgi:thioredoxin-like negative regulator of GroEL
MMKPLSSQDHDSVLATGLHVLIFRVAESPACQQFQPELERFARRRPDCAVWTVEAMEQRDLADRHGLRALPSIVVYRDGLPARRFAGGMSAEDLEASADEVAAADLEQEINDWMVSMLESGEAGSPFIGANPFEDAGERNQPTSPDPVANLTLPTIPARPAVLSQSVSQPLIQGRPSVQGRSMTLAQPLSPARPATLGRPKVAARPAGSVSPTGDCDQLEAGHAAWYAGDEVMAVRHFTEVLAHDPQSPSALNARGQVLTDAGAAEAGLADLDRFLDAGPSLMAEAYARSARAFALAQVGRHDEADQEMAAALTATPDSAWALLRQARIHLLRGDREAATAFLHRALEAGNPPLTRAQRALAEGIAQIG